MRVSALFSLPILAAVASAQSDSSSSAAASSASDVSSSSIDEHPQTTFLTQTNSLGVVTGQPTEPAVVTSQPTEPAGVTTQPTLATIPAGLPTGIVRLDLLANPSFPDVLY